MRQPTDSPDRRVFLVTAVTLLAPAGLAADETGEPGKKAAEIRRSIEELREHARLMSRGLAGDPLAYAHAVLRDCPLEKYADREGWPLLHCDTDSEKILEQKLDPRIIGRYFRAPGEGSGILCVCITGNRQKCDDPERTAVLQAYAKACVNGNDAVLLCGGFNHFPREHQPDILYYHILNVIGASADPKRHKTVDITAYSWGAGHVIHASMRGEKDEPSELEQRLGGVPVRKLILVEPIRAPEHRLGTSERRVPRDLRPDSITWIYHRPDSLTESKGITGIVGDPPSDATGVNVICIREKGVDHFSLDETAYARGLLSVGNVRRE